MSRVVLECRRVTLLCTLCMAATASGFVLDVRAVDAQGVTARIDTRRGAIGEADPMPLPLGELALGTVRTGIAGLNAAILELQRWGWPMQSVNVNRMEL